MTIQPVFKVEDLDLLWQAVADYPFATVITQGALYPEVSLLPLHPIRDQNRLVGHFSRANAHWKAAEDGPTPTTVLFNGPHAYISPTFYESEGNVPTWAYVLVQVTGNLRLLDDAEGIANIQSQVKTLEHREEDPDLISKKLGGLVSFEIAVEEIIGKWKVGQNKNEADRLSAARHLAANPHPDVQKLAEWYFQPPKR